MRLADRKKPDRLRAINALPGYIWLTIALAAIVVVYVNPLRETEVDDDFAYALTVRHLLDTGQYRLNDWLTANMPFQAYWGALFARLGGYSHSNLRLSTLVLWAFALVAFYFLCREHGLDRQQAGLLVLGLFSSPLAFKMSFSFMTDVPYLSCLIIALCLYTRGLRMRRYDLMFVASLAASAAILTRQFGAALIGAMVLVWATSADRRRNIALFAVGLASPLVALGWQLRMGLLQPNLATRFNLIRLRQYYSNPLSLTKTLVYRPAIILHYIAFFALPFALLLASEGLLRDRDRRSGARGWLLPAVIAGYMVGVLVYLRLFTYNQFLMPLLLGGNLDPLWPRSYFLPVLFTVLTTLGGILAASCFLSRYRFGWLQLSPQEHFLDFVAAGVVLASLAYPDFYDEYLLPFLPYALIVIGRKCAPLLRQHGRLIAAFCVLIALASAVYTRQFLARNEAFWKGADIARNIAAPQETVSSSVPWACYYYYGAFLAQKPANDDIFRDFYGFWDWFDKHEENARYVVDDRPPANPSWTLIATVPYRPYPFVERRVYVLKRPR